MQKLQIENKLSKRKFGIANKQYNEEGQNKESVIQGSRKLGNTVQPLKAHDRFNIQGENDCCENTLERSDELNRSQIAKGDNEELSKTVFMYIRDNSMLKQANYFLEKEKETLTKQVEKLNSR